MVVFLFTLIPFHCSSPPPIQSSFSNHKLPCLPLQIQLLLDLSCGLASCSPLPLYQALIFHPCLQRFWFILLSSLLLLSPSCFRGHILLNPSFRLFLLKTTAFHRKYREEGSFSSGFPAMLGWMSSSALPASTRDFNWYKKCFCLQQMQILEHSPLFLPALITQPLPSLASFLGFHINCYCLKADRGDTMNSLMKRLLNAQKSPKIATKM